MLIVDDNRVNLLKMKEKMLKLSLDNKDKVLDEYKELATAIDKEEYNALINKIRDNDYTKLPLEEQISFLDEIESNYNSLNELQCGYKNTYDEYAEDELELSDISNILVDNVKTRCSAIQGYLMNKKNLENNKIELDKLNSKLIKLTKRQEEVSDRIQSISDNLRSSLLMVEGRIFGPKNELIHTSITKEFDEIGLDLRKLVDNFNELESELSKAYQDKNDSEEMVMAAKLCFDDNDKSKAIYGELKDGAKESEYRLILLEIVHEICDDTPEYDLMVNKLYRVLNLIEERKYYQDNKFYIDPFDRLKIEEYLEELNKLGDNEEEIDNVKKTITYMISSISNMEEMNDEFVDEINEHCSIISGDDFENVSIVDDYSEEKVIPTKVIKVDELSEDFLLDRATEKADNVIKRVNKLFGVHEEPKEEHVTNPDLIIDSIANEEDNSLDLMIDNVATVEEPKVENEIFETVVPEEIMPKVEEPAPELEPVVFEEPEVKEETPVSVEPLPVPELVLPEAAPIVLPETPVVKKEPITFDDNKVDVFTEEVPTTEKSDIFEEVAPFEEVALFSDRYDGEVFSPEEVKPEEVITPEVTPEVVPDNTVMPDAFWTTQVEEPKPEVIPEAVEEENKVSFDDQIEALMSTNSEPRMKRR